VLALGIAVSRPVADSSPDALYANRSNLQSATAAAEAWSLELARNASSFEAAWKLARADYWLGGHAPGAERRGYLERGITAGERAVALEPNRPEGHFWLAATMGARAESGGLRAGLKYRRAIKEQLEWVLQHAPTFEQGSADRGLGRWYFEVPSLFGGSTKQAERHLRESLKYNPHSTASHYFLAELLFDAGRPSEARQELTEVLDAPFDADWEPENQDFKAKARARLNSK
jgi:tetratricopeptide (TPR) repeat protein